MAAPAWCEEIREGAARRLTSYRIKPCERGGWRVVRVCSTGESHSGFFLKHLGAIEFLRGRLLMMEPCRWNPEGPRLHLRS